VTPATPTVTQAPDIYQWLPFTKAGLSSAATVVLRFGDAYGTFSYTENAAAYVKAMQSLVTSQLAAQIAAAYATPGVAHVRTSQKQVSAGTASITSLRAYGPDSLTFVVAVTEKITATKDGGPSTTSYAVTVTGGDTSWQVSGVELASAGNS
jgi:nucleoid-associated protein YgaU